MKARTIKAVLSKKHNDFLKSIKDAEIKDLITNHSIITGGAIASMLLNEKVSDYDYYFENKETALKVAQYYVNQFKELNGDYNVEVKDCDDRVKIFVQSSGIIAEDNTTYEFTDIDSESDPNFDFEAVKLDNEIKDKEDLPKYRPVFLTSNAITLSNDIQLVIRFYGDADEIHSNYDFEHCKCYWVAKKNHLELPQKSLLCLLNKELLYTGSKYPLASIIRTRKFINRGWQINAGQYVKMAVQLNEMNLMDPAVLEEQLTGVDISYFLCVIHDIKKRIEEDPNFVVTPSYLMEVLDRIF